jgi:hypothetical protein
MVYPSVYNDTSREQQKYLVFLPQVFDSVFDRRNGVTLHNMGHQERTRVSGEINIWLVKKLFEL